MTMPPVRLARSISTWVRSRAWPFSKVTDRSSMDWPMSRKWTFTASPMSTVSKVVPMRSARISALDLVRLVVPKQGMVTARMSVMGRSSMAMARAVMSRARVESSPPDSPTTAVLAPVWARRFFSPRADRVKISWHRAARSPWSAGTKGFLATGRVSVVSSTFSWKYWGNRSGASAGKVDIRWRSWQSFSRSSSVTVSPASNRRWARMVPFSAIRLCPA